MANPRKNPQHQWRGIEIGERMLEEAEEQEEQERQFDIESGRNPATAEFIPTEKQRNDVRQMALAGVPAAHICLMVRWPHNDRPVSLNTLKKHFRNELFETSIQANVQMAGSLYKAGLAGNVVAMMFWLKTRAGWRETTHHEITGKDGKDLPGMSMSGVIMIPGTQTPEEWEAAVANQQATLAKVAADIIAGEVKEE